MKITKKSLSGATCLQSLALAGTAIAMLSSTAAFAQDAEEVAADETIVVTGSLIRNPNLEASSPVTVVSEDEIQLRNTGNAEELLRGLPGAVAGIGSAVNNGNNGFSSIDQDPVVSLPGIYTLVVSAPNGCTDDVNTDVLQNITVPGAVAAGNTLTIAAGLLRTA